MAEPLVLLNYAFVAVVFSLLLGAGVSQRARVGLCWVAIPGLLACVGTKLLRTYDTVDELTFYASYHSHPMNQLVHIVCVPLLLFTVFVFAAYVPPPIKAMPQLTWPLLGACAWSLHHVRAAPLVGSLVSCLTFAMALVATAVVERERRTSNRSFVEFDVGDRVHVLEHAKFAGNVGTVVKRNATAPSVVVQLNDSTITFEVLHSQLRGFGEFSVGDRVRINETYVNHKGRCGTVVHTGEILYPPGAARRRAWSNSVTLNLDPLPGEKEENYTGVCFLNQAVDHLGAGSYGFAAFYAGLVHVFCWYAQIHPGHGIYEGRKPALLDSVLQAFLDAPLFVWYEVAFACGYDPSLKQELDAAVAARHAAWDL
jgi:uncharacterized membrane protein YGL010W